MNDPVCVCSAVYFDFKAAGAKKRWVGIELGERKGLIFYLNGLKVRRHLLTIMERSLLFAIIAHARVSSACCQSAWRADFKEATFHSGAPSVGVRPRQKQGNFCAWQLPAQLHPEIPPRERIGSQIQDLRLKKKKKERKRKEKKNIYIYK